MKNIVFFIKNISSSAGSERVTSILANNLCASGYHVTILSICGANNCFYDLDARIDLITLINKEDVNNKKVFFRVNSELKKFYKSHQIDLVIDVFASLSIYTLHLKRKFGFKNITWEHFNSFSNVGFNKIGRKFAAKKSDCIVVLTDTDKTNYQRIFPRMKARIKRIFNPSPYQNEKLDLSQRENVILSVGRLTYQKGFDVMIKIWSKINNKNWKLYIVGGGEEEQRLKDIIKNTNCENISILPSTNKIEDYYRQAKIYLSTSRFEGLPMTMIEAQSFGIPIISFDYNTGPKDIIEHEENGFLIENNQIDEFCIYVNRLMSDEEKIKEFSVHAFESGKRFESSIIISQWLQLIEEII